FMVLKIDQPKEFPFNYGKWVLLDNLADPGNVGTIIRTADAAGFDGVVLSPESVDLYNPKTQRAMQGSQFHIELIKQDLTSVITTLKSYDIPVYASMLDKSAKELPDFEKVPQLGLVIGNEAHGVSDFIAKLSDEKLYIPIKGQAESLNAAVAAGIMIYHFA
ncbi:TrmH family RNA methyltransferase, partial [Lactobacillus intestinalis]